MVNSIELFEEVMGATVTKFTNYAVVVGRTLYVNLKLSGLAPELERNKEGIIVAMNEVLEKEMIDRAVIMGPQELDPALPI